MEDAQELLDGIKESMEQNAGDAQGAGGAARDVPGRWGEGCAGLPGAALASALVLKCGL